MTTADFPIHSQAQRMLPLLPRFVPWDRVAPFEANAQANHGQSLGRLAERGGLTWGELRLVIEGKRWDGRTYSSERDPEWIAQEAVDAAWVLRWLTAANGRSDR